MAKCISNITKKMYLKYQQKLTLSNKKYYEKRGCIYRIQKKEEDHQSKIWKKNKNKNLKLK
jgi:hypothetical protein